MATSNGTAASLRVFVSWWANPIDVNSTIEERRVVVCPAAGQHLPVTCAEWRIDKHNANAYTAWMAMGRPFRPNSTQMEVLHAASELKPVPCQQYNSSAVVVTLSQDSAVVLAFGP